MAAPMTVRVAGRFRASTEGAGAGEAVIRMQNATRGSLALGNQQWPLTATVATKTFHGQLEWQVLRPQDH